VYRIPWGDERDSPPVARAAEFRRRAERPLIGGFNPIGSFSSGTGRAERQWA